MPFSDPLTLAATGFYHKGRMIGYSDRQQQIFGTQQLLGFELEAAYRADRWRITFSHGIAKLLDMDARDDRSNALTMNTEGYGFDFINWSTHITKLTAAHELDDHWTVSGSLRVYWGFDDAPDWAIYQNDDRWSFVDPPLTNTGYSGYGASVFLNLGIEYKVSDQLSARVDGYNLMGIFEEKLNKRRLFRPSFGDGYRSHAPAIAIGVRYRF